MRLMAFVGSPQNRYEAEKMFRQAPEVNLVKSFDTKQSFLQDLKRDEHSLHTAILCLPDDQSDELKQKILVLAPKALVIKHKIF